MPAGLDHVAHAVGDLDAAAHLYRRLGFTVGARNQHPWGTHNHVVQLPGFFIELLTVAEPDKLGTDGFSRMFGAFNRDFLARGDGLSLLILESTDAVADAAGFGRSGIAAADAMRFEREGKRPDGTPVTVAFSLAFARNSRAPLAGFATCQQHYPENFWNPQFQQHANSANAIAGIVMVADDPAAHREFIAAFTGRPDVEAVADGFVARTARGEIAVLTPDAFRTTYATQPPSSADGARLAALRFRVTDIAAAEDALAAGEVEADIGSDRIVVAPEIALGATIVFEDDGGTLTLAEPPVMVRAGSNQRIRDD